MKNLVMKELEKGRGYANQIQRLIIKSDNGEDDEDEALTTSYAQDLAAKMEGSLRNAILLLNNQDSIVNFDESRESSKSRSQTAKNPIRLSTGKRFFKPRKTDLKQTKILALAKNRIIEENINEVANYSQRIEIFGGRKSIQTWEEHSKIPKEDGYAWRKYGEKIILNAKYPRCYFRCSHKYEQGCEATKQVQIIQDDPPLYRTTYFGYHTCKKPRIFLDSHDVSSSSTRFISFDNNHNNNTFLLSSFPHPIRDMKECCKNCKQETINDYVPPSSSNDCLLSSGEILPFEYDDLIWM